ncbi:MAG: type II toxin-antitoxin system VapC family toxin [Anaerolineae bacterium]|nr:type II toxin-antitoxin system VapC family toxin [Anaerolineae bacterium]
MSRAIFVDTSAWIAVANQGDNNHTAALYIYPRLLANYQRLVTTNLVIAEVYITLRYELGHRAALTFLENVRTSPRIERVFSTPTLEQEAETILRRYDDQDFSYTDAVSFALMKARGIKEAFTFDKHFSVMGFRRMPETSR